MHAHCASLVRRPLRRALCSTSRLGGARRHPVWRPAAHRALASAPQDDEEAAAQRWLAGQPPSADPRTAKVLQLARRHGVKTMMDSIERNITFATLPTILIGGCSTGALLGMDLSSSGGHLIMSQAVVALLGSCTCSSFFYLAHASSLYAGLQYSPRGIGALQFVQRHGWRLSTLVRAGVATQATAAGGTLFYVWGPPVAAWQSALPFEHLCVAPAFLSTVAFLAVIKQRNLFRSLREDIFADSDAETIK